MLFVSEGGLFDLSLVDYLVWVIVVCMFDGVCIECVFYLYNLCLFDWVGYLCVFVWCGYLLCFEVFEIWCEWLLLIDELNVLFDVVVFYFDDW